MERSGVVLIGLLCVLFSRVSGEEVEMKVRPGDDARLYCDRSWKTGVRVWCRNSSNEDQPPLVITEEDLKNGTFPRYSFVWNPSIRTHDLLVKNVSQSDLGRYYCGAQERKLSRYKPGRVEDVNYLGYRITRLSFFDDPHADPPDCSVYWKLLVSVCPVCVLLMCVWCIYHNKTTGSRERREPENVFQVGGSEDHQCGSCVNGEFCFYTEVCYTSLKSDYRH